MNFELASRLRYYSKDNSAKILERLQRDLSPETLQCRHELLCLFDDMISTVPCRYWNRNVYTQAIRLLEQLAISCEHLKVDERIMELFLIGYSTYTQVTCVISDLSGLNDLPAIKNRQYRLPTYNSIVEGCLTNLFRFLVLLIDQGTEKDYTTAHKLSPLCDILLKNGFSTLTESIDINIRNAINHGGVLFREDGKTLEFHYMENRHSISCTVQAYEFDSLIEKVFDTASAVILAISMFLNNHWNIVQIDRVERSYVALALFSMELSIPSIRCRYINEVPNKKQLNADLVIANTDRTFILQTAIELSMLIYSQYNDYENYYISFSSERLSTSWVRFINSEIFDMIERKREFTDVIADAIKRNDVIIFNPSVEPVDLQEIKYFRFPNYTDDLIKITKVEDASLPDRKRLKCHLFVDEVSDKNAIITDIKKCIDWMKHLKNVDSPTYHHKYGDMEADSIYINVYRHDARRNKGLFPNNENFVCFVDYNISGNTSLVNGGIPEKIWNQFYHEKIGLIDFAWREGKYTIRHIHKIGVNEPCPCGSGKKFKKCCKGKGIFD